MSTPPTLPIVTQLQAAVRRSIQALPVAVELPAGIDDIDINFEHPANEEHGDWSTNIAMQLFGQAVTPSQRDVYPHPRALADAIATQLRLHSTWENITVAGGGFINISLTNSDLAAQLQNFAPQNVMVSAWKGQTWLVEHTSPNPNKAMHLGHLRNNVTGMALANIWQALGINIIRDAVDNNRGIAIAKLMWGFLKFARRDDATPPTISQWQNHPDAWHTPQSRGERPDRFMDRLYTLAAQDCQDYPASEQIVRQMVLDWENQDAPTWELWRLVLSYVYDGQNLTLTRLGNIWDQVWHEHEHYEKGKDLVQAGIDQGVFRTLPDGAVLTNLESDFQLTDTIVRKADGTSLYITQDLALTQLKKQKFNPDRLFWIVGPEQALALQQMFAVCEQLGIGKRAEFTHLPYGYMSLRGQGKMSSRLGNVVYIDDLIDQVKEALRPRLAQTDLDAAAQEKTAEILAVGSVKYSILRVNRMTDIAFDVSSSIALDGDSVIYLNYTYARCQSVLDKISTPLDPGEALAAKSWLTAQEDELNVARWLLRYPEAVMTAGTQYSPNALTAYLYELAQRYNALYNALRIINAESPTAQQQRLFLTQAVAQTLQHGLQLLGIQTVSRM